MNETNYAAGTAEASILDAAADRLNEAERCAERYEKQKQLTVRELIRLLQEHDQDLPVWVEGCDCVGEAGSVERDGEGYVQGGRGEHFLPNILIKRVY